MYKPLSLVLWIGLVAFVLRPAIGQPSDSLYLCSPGNAITPAPSGVLYDSGGPDGNYADNESCSLLIEPGCVVALNIFIDYLYTESCCDRLAIYDGGNEQAPLVATLSGYFEGLSYSSSSGKFFLQWFADGSVIERGFRLEWSAELAPPEPAEAAVSVSDPAPALQEPVQFTASATNSIVSWFWSFGDGAFSNEQNPVHAFGQPGNYTAQLVVVNCHGLSDTVETGIQVQGAPALSIDPPALDLSANCGDTVFAVMQMANEGEGELLYRAGVSFGYVPQVVVYTRNANSGPLSGLLSALAATGAEHSLRTTMATDAAQLAAALQAADVLILPDSYQDSPSTQLMAPAIQDFVSRGGSVIFLASENYQYWIEATGLLAASSYFPQYYSYQELEFTVGHPLTGGVPPLYFAPYFCGGLPINNPDYVSLCTRDGYSILGYRQQGRAKAIYLGFNFFNYDDTAARLLGNALEWCSSGRWLSITPASGQVAAGGTQALALELFTDYLPAGVYSGQVSLQTNDPMQLETAVPFRLQVEGAPVAETETSSLVFGVTQQYARVVRQMTVHNTGCDTLHWLSAGTDNPYFLLLSLPDAILPWQSAVLKVAYAPQEPGAHSGQLTLETDGGAIALPLSGVAVAAPVSAASPASLSGSFSCDESYSQTVTLSNSGQGVLNFQMGGTAMPKRVLGLTYGASYWKWSTLRNMLETTLSNVEVREYGNASPEALADSLAWANILVLPPFDFFSDPAFDGFRPAVQEFLARGGQALVMGWYNTGPVTQMGLLPDYFINGYYDVEVAATIPAHAILDGYGRRFRINDAGYFANLAANGLVRLAEYNGELYLAYLPTGLGNVIFWGAGLEVVPPRNTALLANLMHWMANPLPPGLSVAALSGALPTGNSQDLAVLFNGQGVPAGQYSGQLRLATNDPVNNPLIIPIQVEALGLPCIQINYETTPCSGRVNFSEETLNGLSSWYWSFGDGFDAFTSNPVHTYAAGGAYAVTLVGCNNAGCDTATLEVAIDPFDGPTDASCTPQTLDYCCEAGIFQVQLADLDHSSGNASEGYQNFSCDFGATLTAGSQYPVAVVTGNQADEHVRVWADLNDNGVFGANELLFSSQAYINHQGFLTIPLNAVRNTPLRLRVASEPYYYAPPDPCGPISRGQVEDYFIVVQEATATQEPSGSLSARLFPNPSAGEAWLEVELEEQGVIEARFNNLAGAEVCPPMQLSGTPGTNRRLLPGLPEGLYVVTVRTSRGSAVLRWVKVGGM
ncbi:MAG: PKD domain-containing protein [Phaeodactylibacter sp.]|nr:PKD domain-containing protein [Phaeodactylibacter sp.]